MSPAAYPKVRLGGPNGPEVSAIGFGAMGIGATVYGPADEQAAFDTLTHAADLGVTFWDTSDVYGASEATIGKWFAATGRRKEIFFATKFGSADTTKTPGTMEFYQLNSKPSFIKYKVEETLRTCQTDYIDLYYQHRVDRNVPIEVVMETLKPYVEKGTIKYVGISEVTVELMRRAKSVLGDKLIAVQMEYSPFELEIEGDFIAASKELNISVVAYSPLGRGMMSGAYRSRADFEPTDSRLVFPRFSEENFPKNLVIVDKFQEIANKHNATPSQVTLSWVRQRHPGHIIPIPGSRSVKRLEENAASVNVVLTEEDMKELNAVVDAVEVKGDRYPEAYAYIQNRECIPLSEWKGE
ncbi:NADP-dependent oxidoreductase domain-containing protein [Cristinia sonorae]|uniref:NADP-dependent oxidoreductase domain-containing protein n=1 Tax=Cristinia sonorae TaxID=1940300 RepID=A0A8K0XSK3_9AGAR|nr:NADP-dependent oxidoreductase domain-containing protein [Cristinia sonorae]